ncbi:MAG: hypothetical protein H7197_13505 [Vitreoscilla sp.]|nr:hypothetical protein [Polaromonas sp.]
MHQKLIPALVSAAFFLATTASHAQDPTPPASSAAAQPVPATPAKKALVARILKIQQPVIEGLSRDMAERPAQAVMEKAGMALSNSVPADKREATAKDVESLVKKYLDEAVPLVTSRALKLAPTTVGTLLEDKFSEADLKQLINFLESPVYNKYQKLGGDMQKVLLEKLLADTRGTIEPKVVALDQAVGKRLGVNMPAGSPAGK